MFRMVVMLQNCKTFILHTKTKRAYQNSDTPSLFLFYCSIEKLYIDTVSPFFTRSFFGS